MLKTDLDDKPSVVLLSNFHATVMDKFSSKYTYLLIIFCRLLLQRDY